MSTSGLPPERPIVAIFCVAATFAATAGAEAPASAPACPRCDFAAAKPLYDAGYALLSAKRPRDALVKFQAARATCGLAGIVAGSGDAHRDLGELVAATNDYELCVRLNPCTVDPGVRAKLEDHCRSEAASLQSRLPHVRVTAKSRPAGLHIAHDGVDVPLAALGEPLPLDPGTHRIVAEAPGFERQVETITVAEKQTADVDIALKSAPTRSHFASFALAGGAVALAGVGIGLGYRAYKADGDLTQTCETSAAKCTEDAKSAVRHEALVADVVFGAAGAAAVAAAGVYLFVESPRVKVEPRHAGLALTVQY